MREAAQVSAALVGSSLKSLIDWRHDTATGSERTRGTTISAMSPALLTLITRAPAGLMAMFFGEPVNSATTAAWWVATSGARLPRS